LKIINPFVFIKKRSWSFLILLLLPFYLISQNTVGTLTLESESLEGYNLFCPNNQSSVYLVDNCGRVINKWSDDSLAHPGTEQYLLNDGSLIRSKADLKVVSVSGVGAGGAGGVIERKSWDNEILWQFVLQDSLRRQHHDFEVMPNGNILAIVWDKYILDSIVAEGFDTISNPMRDLWPDKIVEIDPILDSIVWEWKAWDHMIQDYDSTKTNFGVVSDHPELIDINYQKYTFGRADWMHSNGIDYHPDLDQIVLSVRNYNEIWIIDHSTTSAEAATHAGGNSGKGGDLLYRWGNPESYGRGTETDRKLFFQHDPSWILDTNSAYFGQIMLYNNFIELELSLGAILDPNFDYSSNSYPFINDHYYPLDVTRNISHPDTLKNYSTSGSSIQLLNNGNFIMCAAREGFAFELNPDNEVLWEYEVPFRNGFRVEQGSTLFASDNFTFSLRRYSLDHPAFVDKDMSPKGYLELDPNLDFCTGLVSNDELSEIERKVYPSPADDYLIIEEADNGELYLVIDIHGNKVMQKIINDDEIIGKSILDISRLPPGVYILVSLNKLGWSEKFVKM